jgi:hypothetical protein
MSSSNAIKLAQNSARIAEIEAQLASMVYRFEAEELTDEERRSPAWQRETARLLAEAKGGPAVPSVVDPAVQELRTRLHGHC